MSSLAGLPTGYRFDKEDFEYLASQQDDRWKDAVMERFSAPEELLRRWLRTENQQSQGSCQGCALSEVGEVCYNVATGDITQFSKQYCYIRSQYYDGIRGDSGSTLAGGAKVALNDGLLPETEWEYTGRYVTKPPKGTWDDVLRIAGGFKLKTVTRLRNYDEAFSWLAGGVGSIWIGIPWGGGGGHSVHVPGYHKRKTPSSRNPFDLHNSWDTTWGDGGWKKVPPEEVDSWFRKGVVMGGSDMEGEGIVPRPVDYLKDNPWYLK